VGAGAGGCDTALDAGVFASGGAASRRAAMLVDRAARGGSARFAAVTFGDFGAAAVLASPAMVSVSRTGFADVAAGAVSGLTGAVVGAGVGVGVCADIGAGTAF